MNRTRTIVMEPLMISIPKRTPLNQPTAAGWHLQLTKMPVLITRRTEKTVQGRQK
ncbi:hypothetical protein FBUS_09969 [Fasciolopsis buskii]|uniref:Uncharacterized protein n=1 Tax=Fasciolopsis buskii TaxID=27845 RepID=A0A8E0VN27_9TREM|nr:hypothetical protein FBUS_09969 [Fasciolopsis buski]